MTQEDIDNLFTEVCEKFNELAKHLPKCETVDDAVRTTRTCLSVLGWEIEGHGKDAKF